VKGATHAPSHFGRDISMRPARPGYPEVILHDINPYKHKPGGMEMTLAPSSTRACALRHLVELRAVFPHDLQGAALASAHQVGVNQP
jgi:hypothetical protein